MDFHLDLSAAMFGAVFMVSPLALRSLSIVRLHVSFGRPLFLLPCGVHRRAVLGIE